MNSLVFCLISNDLTPFCSNLTQNSQNQTYITLLKIITLSVILCLILRYTFCNMDNVQRENVMEQKHEFRLTACDLSKTLNMSVDTIYKIASRLPNDYRIIIQFGDRKIYRFRDDVIEFLTKGELSNGQ